MGSRPPTIVLGSLLPRDQTTTALKIVRAAAPESRIVCIVRAPDLAAHLVQSGETVISAGGPLQMVRQTRALRADLFLAFLPGDYVGTLTAARLIGLLALCAAGWRALVLANGGWESLVWNIMDLFSRGSQAGFLQRLGLRIRLGLATLKVFTILIFSCLFALPLAALSGLLVVSVAAMEALASLARPRR